MDERLRYDEERANKRFEAVAAKLRDIADIIGKRPVLGHWPANRAHLDQQMLILAAEAMLSLNRELTQVAKLGHQLMAQQLSSSALAPQEKT